MRIDITSLCFGFKIEKENDSGTPAWATSIGQAPKDICYVDTKIDGLSEFIFGMMYKSHSDFDNLKDSNVPGLDKREEPRGGRERMMFSVFEDVYVNNMKIDGIYTLTYEREDTSSHKNRLHICYAKYLTYKDHSNKETLKEMAKKLGCSDDACWFVTDISIRNQKDLHFTAVIVNSEHSMTYKSSKERKYEWEKLIPDINEKINKTQIDSPLQQIFYGAPGTGKSFEIKEQTKDKDVIRTTFHPDSDYSTFVGAYKPIMEETDVRVVPVVLKNGASFDQNNGTYKERRITYKFVKQAFLKAYLSAWKKYADSCSICSTCSTPAVHEFDTGIGRYVINSVGMYELTLSREFRFPKALAQKEWPNLWNNGVYNVPKGPQTGKSVQHAIANWIFEKIDSCTIDKFEEGWNKLVETVKEKGHVDVQKTQIYIISGVAKDNETLTINVEARGKKKSTLKRKFNELDETKLSKLEKALIDILKRYSSDFEDAWELLKQKINEGNAPEVMDESDGQISPQFLVIEEINRGNCAQIFGDIFQLLDRGDNGFSVYPIEADSDLRDAIKEAFAKEDEYMLSSDIDIDDVIDYTSNYDSTLSADVQSGRVLLLPPNLYIWATMNTSDQSLFPIDSAFKRRWEWIYVPISNAGKAWKICVNGTEYDWWSFVERINSKIWDATKSEDKKLGYFFCKADRKVNESDDENNIISADRFVGKVLFYVYNDVFKDYGFDDAIFKDIEDGNSELSFQCFFKSNGKPNEEKIEMFLKNLEVKLASEVAEKDDNDEDKQSEDQADNQESAEGAVVPSSTFKVQLDGEIIEESEQFNTYLIALKKMGMDKVEEIAVEKEYNRYDCPFVSKEQFDAIKEKDNFSYVEADGYQVIKGINKRGMSNFLKLCAERLGHNITIE